MYEDDLGEFVVVILVVSIMLKDTATSSNTLESSHVDHLSLSTHYNDILDGVSSLLIESHILHGDDLHEDFNSYFMILNLFLT